MKRNATPHYSGRQTARAFSLVEMLVVIAITTILLALLFGPIISSFNLTRRARAVAQAQDAARFGLERLSRELGRATYIYDNGVAPIAIPMAFANVPTQNGQINIGDPTDPLNPNGWPRVNYGRIDIVQAAVRQDSNDIIDPTTGQPVGGAEIQPGVRGKRVVRYFLGLRFPRTATGAQRLYSNLFEFRTGERTLNPVILYRAEYDPNDPNLFDFTYDSGSKTRLYYNSTLPNSGGFNDPAFFYADKVANTTLTDEKGNPVLDKNGNQIKGNGKTYGENWQTIAQPILVSENVDLLRWNRVGAVTNRNEKDANDPFTPTTTFSPVSVAGDVAAPASLSAGGVETPSAVPTLYQAKYGAWAYPYKLTILRGSTGYNPSSATPRDPEPFGAITMTVDRDVNGAIFIVSDAAANPQERRFASAGSLQTTPASNLFTWYSPTARKLYVKTPNLMFAVDPDRGRVETAFPPLMGTVTANIPTPYFKAINGNVIPVTAGFVPGPGEIVPMLFKLDTRDPAAGTGTVPTNMGIVQTDLFTAHYVPVEAALTGPSDSPLYGFGWNGAGGTATLRGVRIIPGSERISAPVVVDQSPTSWTRVSATGDIGQPQSTIDNTSAIPRFSRVLERFPRYIFNYDLEPASNTADLQQIVQFDIPAVTAIDDRGPSGLPAAETGAPLPITANSLGNFVTATYLWQNNFSRDTRTGAATWGFPLDATLNPVFSDVTGTAGTRPEADIFRIDYATRQQFSINLGARIYDPTDGRVQSIQVTDKVIINNVIR